MQINNRDVMRYHESAREIAAPEQIAQGHGDLVESRRPATDQIVRNHIVVAGNRSVQDEVRQKAISELRKWTGESELAASFIRVLDDQSTKPVEPPRSTTPESIWKGLDTSHPRQTTDYTKYR
jgi:hypothetical protein